MFFKDDYDKLPPHQIATFADRPIAASLFPNAAQRQVFRQDADVGGIVGRAKPCAANGSFVIKSFSQKFRHSRPPDFSTRLSSESTLGASSQK